ncbi:GNAT family N-acetyltransferase [Saccharospirillum sp.]|uniref:GNAT family N-acetyltransferase n=1 Tax=Saccharospirillum sp. TaxID=2033801 RepID=UPI00349FE044
MNELTVKWTCQPGSIVDLKSAWTHLLEVSKVRGYYQDWRWTESLISDLHIPFDVLSVFHKNTPIALMPLCFDSQLRTITLPHNLQIDLSDCLVDSGFLNSSLGHLLHQQFNIRYPGWKRFEARRAKSPSNIASILSQWPGPKHRDTAYQNFFFLTRTHDDRNLLSKKHVKNVRRLESKLARLYKLEYLHGLTDPSSLEIFLNVEHDSWKGADNQATSILSNEEYSCFYRQLRSQFSGTLQFSISLLLADGRAIAGQLSLIDSGVQYLLKIAYRREVQEFGAGNILLLDTLERAYAEAKLNEVNLVTGPDWALRWHPKETPVEVITLFNGNLAGRASYAIYYLKDLIRPIKEQICTKWPKSRTPEPKKGKEA